MKLEVFEVLKVAQIPATFLPDAVVKEMEGREMFINAGDEMIHDRIFSFDIFETISGEQAEITEKDHSFKMSEKDIKFMDELSTVLAEGNFDYIMLV